MQSICSAVPPVGLEQPTDSSRDKRGGVSAVSPAVSSAPEVSADALDDDDGTDLAGLILKRQRLAEIARHAAELSDSDWASVVAFASELAHASALPPGDDQG
ncbi:hypothetical protein [Planctomycetes bacterium TBK1r]|uniref:hypothetical protein n=1 Tax=Stieleria magnilauensis TaxID=2527963 RepID=UPI0011A71FE2